ncbi:hypothetical protein CO709_16010 [Burkholderia thailandensis]|nr:hypothetical protein CO709_16010 [Burkholderia thailandensis]
MVVVDSSGPFTKPPLQSLSSASCDIGVRACALELKKRGVSVST